MRLVLAFAALLGLVVLTTGCPKIAPDQSSGTPSEASERSDTASLTQDGGMRASLFILAAMLLFPFLICGACGGAMLAFDFMFSGM